MSNKTNPTDRSDPIAVGDVVRILTPAIGVLKQTKHLVGKTGLVDQAGRLSVRVGRILEPGHEKDGGWWYRRDEVELVTPAPDGPGWYVAEYWCDDAYVHMPGALVFALHPAEALAAAGYEPNDPDDEHSNRARRISLPASPNLGTVIAL